MGKNKKIKERNNITKLKWERIKKEKKEEVEEVGKIKKKKIVEEERSKGSSLRGIPSKMKQKRKIM